MLAPDALMEQMSKFVLYEPLQREKKPYRNHLAANTLVRQAVREALSHSLGKNASKYVKAWAPVAGALFTHKFGVTVQNGIVYGAADGLSFEVPEAEDRQKEIDSLIGAISDVRDLDRSLPLAAMILPPKRQTTAYRNTLQVLNDRDVIVLHDERDAEQWTRSAMTNLITNNSLGVSTRLAP